jgi:hypothetical protein
MEWQVFSLHTATSSSAPVVNISPKVLLSGLLVLCTLLFLLPFPASSQIFTTSTSFRTETGLETVTGIQTATLTSTQLQTTTTGLGMAADMAGKGYYACNTVGLPFPHAVAGERFVGGFSVSPRGVIRTLYVDAFLIDSTGYKAYYANVGNCPSIPSTSLFQVNHATSYHFDVTFPQTGDYYLVFVNYSDAMGTIIVAGDVYFATLVATTYTSTNTYPQTNNNAQIFTVPISQPNAALLVPLGIVLVVVIALLFLVLRMRTKRKR